VVGSRQETNKYTIHDAKSWVRKGKKCYGKKLSRKKGRE
jgi:hypothetical protein